MKSKVEEIHVLNRLPALPRFSDPAQRRAGGHLIQFLAGLLALTLIARGTSGATLAKVDVSGPSRGEIVEAVTGNATVSARDTLDITTTAIRTTWLPIAL